MTAAVRMHYLGELDDPDEQAVIRQADQTCFQGLGPPLDFGGAHWWVIGDPDQPMAYGGIRPSRQYSDCAYLVRAGVLPQWRGGGLQKRLVRARVAWARRQGFRWVITDTSCDNAPSANSLITAGFRVWAPPDNWHVNGALWLSRRL